MTLYRHSKRTGLFLVRIWLEEPTESGAGAGGKRTICRGRVQRVVNGESHEFDGWRGLTDALAAMLSVPGPAEPEPDDPPSAPEIEA